MIIVRLYECIEEINVNLDTMLIHDLNLINRIKLTYM